MGEELEDPIQVNNEIVVGFNKNLIGRSTRIDSNFVPDFGKFISKKLSEEQAAYMVRPIQAKEIKEVVFSFPDDKASGPDGYSVAFFKNSWSIIGEEIIADPWHGDGIMGDVYPRGPVCYRVESPRTNYTVMKRMFDEDWGAIIAKTVTFPSTSFDVVR
ncbi:hypothetical protein BUALT_Bualt12G0094000 [Buddleja alternifolia]|uniref:Uncharacterized protein n=1 Tax=Buddleja alternifolia TaxID=168488 RepID=A0AAV6X0B1_9LAMI|nr:hypothetical protein BUALT_Bualt12G0094000 [Buddleja alternifolia]